jgi:hypothetical protein
MAKRILYGSVLVLSFITHEVFSQDQPAPVQLNCTQTLRTARGTYDQGRLHELPVLVNGCLTKSEDNGGFTQAERIEAYRILTLSYIYLEEPAEADQALINLLHTDPFFQVNPEVDPIEFKNLYKKFRTNPIYRVGLRFGGNTTHVNVLTNHYMWAASAGKGEYKSKIGIQIGGSFEKDLNDRFIANAEGLYSTYSVIYNNGDPLSESSSGTETGQIEHIIAQSKAQLNLLVLYRLKKPVNIADKFIPYVGLGPTVNYLLASSFEGNTNIDEEVTGPAFSTTTHYKPLTFAVTAVAGVRVKVGGIYISGDVRFQYGFMNVVNKSNRWRWTVDDEKLVDFGYVDNDFSLSQSMFNLGIIVPKFSPKKLIR